MTDATTSSTSAGTRSLRIRRLLGLVTTAVLAVGGALVAPIAASAAPHHQITVDVTEVANEKIVVNVTGSGFDDVQQLPGQTSKHVYLALIPKGTDLATVGQGGSFPNISADVAADGSLTYAAPLEASAADLVQDGSYEVISWPSRSNPTDANLYTRADAVIDWAALFPAAPAVPTLSGEVTEFANDRVDIAVTGSGFDEVPALPGQAEPHVYVKLSEVGADLSTVAQDDPSLAATVVNGEISGTLSVPAAGLDKTKSYELISWPSRSFPTEANVYARSAVTIDWAALFPAAPAVPTLAGDVTEVANDRVDIAVTGSGFDEVPALPGQAEPHVYVKLSEVGVDLSTVAQDDPSLAATVVNGEISGTLSVPAAGLDKTKSYELISWPSRSFPTEGNVYARADVTIDWAALFPAPVYTPKLSVTPATDLDRDGETVTVSGEGYDPNQPIYIFACADIDLPANLWDHAAQCRTGAKVVYQHGAVDTSGNPRPLQFDANGAFETTFAVAPVATGDTAVFTAANHTAPTNRGQDAKVSLEFAPIVYEPVLTVSPNADLNPAGATVTVTGTGYNPNQPIYVTPCADVPLENVSFDFINAGCTAGAQQVSAHGKPSRPGALEFGADGSFTTTMTVSPRANADATSLYTIANHTARNDRGQDAKATLDFAPAHETSVEVTVAPSDAVFGDEVTLTATVTPLGAAGTVTFFDGDTQIGSPVSAVLGSASVKSSELTAGAHEITAQYTPANANVYEASESEAQSLAIAKRATETTLEASSEESTFGDTVTLTATVAPAIAGSVEFFDASGSVGSGSVNAGVATLGLDALAAGDYTFTAEFTPADAANYSGSEADELVVSVAKAATATTLTAPATVELGAATTLTASVKPAVPGVIAFFDGDTQIGDEVAYEGGTVSIETAELDASAYAFRAVFTPADADNYESSAGTASVTTVDHSAAVVTINGEATAKVAAGDTVVFTAGDFAAGTELTAVVHSDPIILGTKTVDANGVASFRWTVPASFEGDHTVIFTTADGTEYSADFSVRATATDGSGETPEAGNGVSNNGNGGANGGTTAAGTGAKGLAQTGSDGIAGVTAAAMFALLAGAGLVLMRRRERLESE